MLCPRCGTEFPEGATRCATCGTDRVAGAAADSEDHAEWRDLVAVYEGSDPSILEVVRSLLEAERIPCVVRDGRTQDLIGLGRLPFGVNLATGPARVEVPAELAEAARELIADRTSEIAPETEPPPA